MSLPDAVAALLLVVLGVYAVFGGADFGAGFWDLIAGRARTGAEPRKLIEHAIGPVWEANHVWLIFALVITWTAFGEAFASVMSTLFIPLSLAALGIVLRGSGFAFRHVMQTTATQRPFGAVFAISSIITPFFMGTAAGAIAVGRVPVGNAAGDPVSSWLNLPALTIGVLFVATCAYLAAVLLTVDATRLGNARLHEYFRRRAIISAVVAGAIAMLALIPLHDDAKSIFDGLTDEALPLMLLSVLCGAGALVALLMRWRGSRPLAALAVLSVVIGWGVAQHPYLLPPELTISAAAAPDATLVSVLVVAGLAVLLVAPSIGFLYLLDQRTMLTIDDREGN